MSRFLRALERSRVTQAGGVYAVVALAVLPTNLPTLEEFCHG